MKVQERIILRKVFKLDPQRYERFSGLAPEELDEREKALTDACNALFAVAEKEERDLTSEEADASDLAMKLIRDIRSAGGTESFSSLGSGETARYSFNEKRTW